MCDTAAHLKVSAKRESNVSATQTSQPVRDGDAAHATTDPRREQMRPARPEEAEEFYP
jgi:hypothetical protein